MLINADNSRSVLSGITVTHSSLFNGRGKEEDKSVLVSQGDNAITDSSISNLQNASMEWSGTLNFSNSTLKNEAGITLHDLTMQGGTVNNRADVVASNSNLLA
ncbi:MAG: hypothetical protein XXXJIFNMEKO3_00752 [Candidatus Erwinia impunctatus]|nr:hypothetical protein XXXJIFNMEKO_00752 [Culicoides impunctatus]